MLNIYDLNLEEIKEVLMSNDIASFRAKQIWNFLYVWHVKRFEDMKTIAKNDQEKLKQIFTLSTLEEVKIEKSLDKTQKALLKVQGGEKIETVLMKYKHGYSVCVSSQIGCKVGCSFCASGLLGFKRNLTTAEIVSQVMYWDEKLKKEKSRVSNVVIMGIGEPFDNLNNVLKFIDIINDDKGLNIAARKITISTSGLSSKFEDFLKYKKQVNLAISLHAPTNDTRSKIMKINKSYNIESIMENIDKYLKQTNRQVTFEYILLKGVNDSIEDAQNLITLINKRNILVNLIPYNKVEEMPYESSSIKRIEVFERILLENNIVATKRQSKGDDINGACGQLRNKEKIESIN